MHRELERAVQQLKTLAPWQRVLRSLLEQRAVVRLKIQDHAGGGLDEEEPPIQERSLRFGPLVSFPLLERQLHHSSHVGNRPSQKTASQVTVAHPYLKPLPRAFSQLTMIESNYRAAGSGSFHQVRLQVQKKPRPNHYGK